MWVLKKVQFNNEIIREAYLEPYQAFLMEFLCENS